MDETRKSLSTAQIEDGVDSRAITEAFSESLPLTGNIEPNLECAIRHVLDNPGSLVRPRMVYQVATAYGLSDSSARDLSIALEYFHTASILFDDLPCMDNGLERRGAPCTHVVFGESGTILTALSLINRAYGLTWRAIADSARDRQAEARKYLEQCLGVQGLLNGQSLDLNYSELPHTLATTERIARGKTVSMIRLTLVLPAMLGDSTVRDLQLLERIALFWGLGYQIVDDLKDVLQGPAETGKTAARDVLLNRPNIAAAIGVPDAAKRLERFIALGDRTLQILLRSRPSMNFLNLLRHDLDAELKRVTQRAMDVSEGSLL